MIGRLNHVAIAVPDLEAAAEQYRSTLGAKVGAPQDEPDHGVTVVFIELPNTKVELLYPLGEKSPIAGFLEKNPSGGIHHMCFEVDDILAARDQLKAAGARVLGPERQVGRFKRVEKRRKSNGEEDDRVERGPDQRRGKRRAPPAAIAQPVEDGDVHKLRRKEG